jgi:hypothetical protein
LHCALSGAALGSDLALPGALLAGLIADAGEQGRAEGAYFGWWNFATKLNLALAAGLALPLLGWLGYAPGARDAQALQMLTVAYGLLPHARQRPPSPSTSPITSFPACRCASGCYLCQSALRYFMQRDGAVQPAADFEEYQCISW